MPDIPFQPVRRLARNTHGRDFIMGDAHGTFDLVERALDGVGFDPARDRLLGAGDLVDRGALSHTARRWLKKSWFHSVRGNHEQMALDAFDADGEFRGGPEHLAALVRNGMAWWLELEADERQEHLRAFERLPFVLEVDTVRGPVGVLHADVPAGMDWTTFVHNIEALHPKTLQTCLWGRQRITSEQHEGVAGVGRVFVGHTPQWHGLGRYGNVYAVDTGAVFGQMGDADGAALTMANICTGTNAMTAAQPVRLLNLIDEPLGCPFGTGPGYIGPVSSNPWTRALLKAR